MKSDFRLLVKREAKTTSYSSCCSLKKIYIKTNVRMLVSYKKANGRREGPYGLGGEGDELSKAEAILYQSEGANVVVPLAIWMRPCG